MSPCDAHRAQLLDRLYGLLDPAEAAALDGHLDGCADCAAARAEAGRWQGLLATAAKSSFPGVRFVPPADTPVPPGAIPPSTLAAVVPSTAPAEPADDRPRVTVTAVCVRWAVAAVLLLAVAGLGGPAARDAAGLLWYRPTLDRRAAEVAQAKVDHYQKLSALGAAEAAADKRVADARAGHDALVAEWVAADERALAAAARRPFTIGVQGPAAAVAGAPNEYTIHVTDPARRPKPVELRAAVRDSDGAVRFNRRLPAAADATFTLPAAMWDGVTPGAELTLTVTGTDPADGAAGEVREDVRLLAPLFTTFLVTDKPLYRPGETVYFRSLTLDRTRFLPPDRDLNLRFELFGPNGQPVPGSALTGLAQPVTAEDGGGFGPVLGPDGRPVRGVGTGAFALPLELAGGEYRLAVTELPVSAARPVPGTKPLAERRFAVLKYTPERFEKTVEWDARSYGPGDPVQAKFVLRDQGKPVAGAKVTVEVQVTTRSRGPAVVPLDVAPPQTDAAGAAAVRFTLPAAGDIVRATLSVRTEVNGVPETVVRPVPLADRTLALEFFPEGGDLVAGVENRVYFRATGRVTGKPADVSGVLTDGARTVCPVRTLTDPDRPGVNQGLGVFTFTPEPGKRYAVRLDRPLGVTPPTAAPLATVVGPAAAPLPDGYLLPLAKPDGVVLTIRDGVTKAGDPLAMRLAVAGAKRSLLIGVYTRGRPVAHRRVVVEAGRPADVTLAPADPKLGGVTRVTVFEEPAENVPGRTALRPVAERLVYRRPGEELRLGFAAAAPGGAVATGPFLPGSPVELTVTAADEAGRPKPAVLMAAVVNRSVLAMADEKTARSLPTHFLLGGEVRKADELEHADVLLTDHPTAAAGLDLLLGTQGWRRFAEQAPEVFRRQSPADADRLLTAMGVGRPVPVGWQDGVRRVADEYWPKYEAAEHDLDQAERDKATGAATRDAAQAKMTADGAYAARQAALGQVAADVLEFDAGMTARKTALPATLVFTFGVGAALLAARLLRPAGAPERRTLARGGLGFLALGAFVLLSIGVAGRGHDSWRAYAPAPTVPGFTGGVAAVKTAPPAPTPDDNPTPVEGAQARLPRKAPVIVGKAPPDGGPGPMRPLVQRGPATTPRAAPPSTAADLRVRPEWTTAPSPAVPRPLPPGRVPDTHRLLRTELTAMARKAATGSQQAALVSQAVGKILQQLPTTPPLVVREYAHARPVGATDDGRTDFAETVLWQPVLVVPGTGRATVSFTLSDALNGYQVLLAGHTLDGRLGAVTGTIEVRKPLAVEPKLPQEIGSADKLDVPLGLTNGTDTPRTAAVALSLTGLKADGADKLSVNVPANGGSRAVVRLTPDGAVGSAKVKVAVAGDGLTDTVERTVAVVPDGFPAEGTAAATLDRQARVAVALPPQWEKGTLTATVTVYPNTLAELQAGLAGLLREPSGCFEQSSTANYPNVLITRYLRDAGQASPDVSRRARELMDRGYAKLTAFECPKGGSPDRLGYEWFGAADRPHDALTAYGLLQFTDMSAVYPVDPAMLRRTKQFLLDRRDGAGGFTRTADRAHQFGRAPDHVVDAYVVWAITEAERGAAAPSDLTKEVDALFALATADGKPAKDPYFLSLVANALLNRGRTADGVTLLTAVGRMQMADGSVPGGETDITSAAGKPLVIESTALAVLGWLKADRPDLFAGKVRAAVGWVGGQRDGGGGFGSTQSTVLALKALIEYARLNRRPAEGGDLRVAIAGREVAAASFTAATTSPVTLTIPPDALRPGANELLVETTAKQPYPVSVVWAYRTRQPPSAAACLVTLTTKLARTEVTEGESVRLDVTVTNKAAVSQGMAVAVVGLPAGLKLPPDLKQLAALTARPADGSEPAVSYWETRGRELVLYWRGLAPNQTVSLGLDLIADVPGEYRGPAGRAYLYYNAADKHWIEPLAVTIRAK